MKIFDDGSPELPKFQVPLKEMERSHSNQSVKSTTRCTSFAITIPVQSHGSTAQRLYRHSSRKEVADATTKASALCFSPIVPLLWHTEAHSFNDGNPISDDCPVEMDNECHYIIPYFSISWAVARHTASLLHVEFVVVIPWYAMIHHRTNILT